MKFHQLIHSFPWGEVEAALMRLYPDAQEDLLGYEGVFAVLRQLEPQESRLQLFIEELEDPETATSQASVAAKDKEHSYFIEFTPWQEWLGMEIDEETRRKYTDVEIVAHGLWEMTFFGYSQEAIQTWMQERPRAAQRCGRVLNLGPI